MTQRRTKFFTCMIYKTLRVVGITFEPTPSMQVWDLDTLINDLIGVRNALMQEGANDVQDR